MKYLKIIPLLFLITLFQNSKAQSYSQPAEVVSSGGGESSGSSYSNFGVIGETFVDFPVVGGDYETSIGFLYVASGIPVNISELSNNNPIKIFPNPTSKELFIEMQNRKDVNISIFNSFGQSVFTSRVQSENGPIDISRLRSGIYFVEIKDLKGNALLSEKIIKE
ncbi:T9SS type A sorting domain-containing protein [candidate division KSB1 bacterium]|nr:T9SS type A sorting domain-containing protein [candidate division KSB1 bacterium]